jgi:curved DNA-binding protein CbpA
VKATAQLNHYELLGISRNASEKDIRSAYLRRARQLHPDTMAGASQCRLAQANEAMARINVAWEILSDPRRRKKYDATLPQQVHILSTSMSPGYRAIRSAGFHTGKAVWMVFGHKQRT